LGLGREIGHNMEEAALIHPNGKKEYHIHGIQYSHDDWKERRRNREGLNGRKQQWVMQVKIETNMKIGFVEQ
jgi:hypothetical protein